jgi:hypothetical protein
MDARPQASPVEAQKRRPPYRRVVRGAAAFLGLNALLNLPLPASPIQWGWLLRLSPDALALFFGLGLLLRPGQRFRPLGYAALTACVIFIKWFQLADQLVPMVFNRAFNLFLDTRRLPDMIFLLWLTRPPELVVLGIAAALAATVAMAWAVWAALQCLHNELTSGSPAHRYLRLGVAALSVAALTTAASAPPFWLSAAVVPRIIAEANFILNLDELRGQHQTLFMQAMDRASRSRGDLAKLEQASVWLIFVESYGMSAFSDPRHAPTVLPTIRSAEAKLQSAGFEMCSAYLTSPTFGGGSWLSHATLASGVSIEGQIAHDLLLASDLWPLAEYFNRAGYRTVRAMPGTLWPWPEGGFYRYQQAFIAPNFAYRGPAFGFAPMPDQFVLDWIGRQVLQRAAQPLLVEVILTGSHATFDVQAPYIADWGRIGDGSVFHTLPPVLFPVGWTELSEASPAYSAAIAQAITLLQDFICRFLEGTELVIIVGDHQPCVELIGADQPWSVPVHVISRNPAFIHEFRQRGYRPGLVPTQPLPHPGLETLFWDLLEGFSVASCEATPVLGQDPMSDRE